MDGDKESKTLSTSSAKCKNCGSELMFDPESKSLKCDSCGSLFPFEIIKDNSKHPLDLTSQTKSTEAWSKESKMVKCKNCGAEVVITGLAVTQNCPYCASEYVVEMDELPGIKPDCVIPFNITKKDAGARFANGIKKKFFVPNRFKKTPPIEKIKGLYIPSFNFDAKTSTTYDGKLARNKTVKTKNGTKTVTETFYIRGTHAFNYEDLLIESSNRVDDADLHKILPYNINESCKFDDDFLRGFYVEHYVDTIDKCYKLAKDKVEAIIKNQILSKYTYSYVVSFNQNTVAYDEKYNYQLLPLYLVQCDYHNKKYNVLMNGQTGKVGKGLPISPVKVTIVTLIGVLLIIGLIVLFLILG